MWSKSKLYSDNKGWTKILQLMIIRSNFNTTNNVLIVNAFKNVFKKEAVKYFC